MNIIWCYNGPKGLVVIASTYPADYKFIKKTKQMSSIKNKKSHQLKITQKDAKGYYGGIKPFVICENDDYEVGDIIEFSIIEMNGRYEREIVYIEKDVPGLKEGYCIITLSGYKYVL